jgi:hypothetical protein
MISKPYLFSAGGPINDGLKLLIDDGAHDLGPDALTVTPSGGAVVGVNGFVGTGATRFSTIGTVSDLTFPQNVGILTAAAWVRPASVASSIWILSSRYGHSANGFSFGWNQTYTAWDFQAFAAGTAGGACWYYRTASNTPTVGRWTFIVLRHDYVAGSRAWYIDGTLSAGSSGSRRELATGDAANAVLMGNTVPGTVHANARFRGVRLWNRVLAASEVRYLYETERPAFGL